MRSLFLTLISSFFPQALFAAACCGGGVSVPSLMTGDDRAQFTTSYAMTEVSVDNVDGQGLWRQWDKHQQVQSFRIEAAHLLSDLWQCGIMLPVIERSRLGERSQGLGDVSLSLGYEYLTDWNYNPYRPKAIVYGQLVLPTGRSRAESTNAGLDSRGNGFLSLGLGTLLTKNWKFWDAFANFELHRGFSKRVDLSTGPSVLSPGTGGNLGLGAGYNFKEWRAGGGLTWTYEDPIAISSASSSRGSIERYATANLSLTYMQSPEWSGSLTYTDQTLFGEPVNTSLGRGLALQLQKRWPR